MILPDDQLHQLLLGAGIIDAATLEEIAVHAKFPHTTLQHALLEPL